MWYYHTIHSNMCINDMISYYGLHNKPWWINDYSSSSWWLLTENTTWNNVALDSW